MPADPLSDLNEDGESALEYTEDPEDAQQVPAGGAANGAAISNIYAAELSRLRAELDALRASNNHLYQQAQVGFSSTAAHPAPTSHASKFVRVSGMPDSAMLETG